MKLLTKRMAALATRKLERWHPDVARIERLLDANRERMSALLVNVEREHAGGRWVVVVEAQNSPPTISVHRRERVLAALKAAGRELEIEDLASPAPAGMFHVLIGTADVMQVRVLERTPAGNPRRPNAALSIPPEPRKLN